MQNQSRRYPIINTVVIGLGNYAKALVQKLVDSGLYKIKYCVHKQKKKADSFAASFDSVGCEDYLSTLDDPDVDAVFIVTPSDSHFELAKHALKAQKHVFLEKPMTSSVNEARELGKVIEESQKVFMVGHNYRRKNGIRFIKQLQEDGKIGRPVHLEMVISHGGAFNFPKDSWRNNPQKCFGGPLSMLGSHSFEVLQYLLGKPLSVYSINHCLQSLSTCYDSTISLLQMKCGATAILTHHYIVPSLSYLRIEGTEGTATYEVDSNKVVFRTGRDENCIPVPCHTYSLKPNDDRLEQVIEFAGAINRGIEVETDFFSAYSVVEFIEKSMQSSMSKKVVFF
jgi:predicted dehydrogenase